ncbi:isochorismatase [Paenibacillus hodogayensis]|uniref:isochorismatase n=1 Tax=Paenibacillus hodogayensis TaxID=279208 RepID=A0ABV5VZ24_9BACL
MALPAILPYTMPTASDLPNNKVSWKPEAGRSVLLIHDMQQYFLDAFTAGQSPASELLANIKRLRSVCSGLGIPVIYTAQPGGQTPEQRALLLDFWGPGIDDGPYQKRIVEELAPVEGDTVLTKWRYSAFCKTNLLELLHKAGRDQLIVCGIYAHIGCLMTACDAFMQDVQPFFVADAVADFSADHHRMALTYAAERCAVVLSAQRLLDELQPDGDGSHRAEASAPAGVAERLAAHKPSHGTVTAISEAAAFGRESSRAASGGVPVVAESASDIEAAAESGLSSAVEGSPGQALSLRLVREQVAELVGEAPSTIGEADNLIDLGLDSVRMMSLVERWRRAGAEISFVELAERPTLDAWWGLLSSRAQAVLPNGDYFAIGRR